MTEAKPTNGLLTDRLNNTRTKNRPIWLTTDRNPPMTDDGLYTSLSANTIMAILTSHVQRTRLITSSTDKHYSLDSEDDFRSGCRNVSHQQQFFSELHSTGRSHYTNYYYYYYYYYYYLIWTFRVSPDCWHAKRILDTWWSCEHYHISRLQV